MTVNKLSATLWNFLRIIWSSLPTLLSIWMSTNWQPLLSTFWMIFWSSQGSFITLLVTLSFRTFSTHYDRQLSSWTFSMHYDRYTDEYTHVQKIKWSDDQKSDTLKVTLTFQCNPIALDLFEYSYCAWHWKSCSKLRTNNFW